jgi:hypothetical protein
MKMPFHTSDFAKGILLHPQRIPFSVPKDSFYNAKAYLSEGKSRPKKPKNG